MRKRSVPVLLPTFLVLGLLGGWAGTSLGQLPQPPVTVSVPTVSVPLPPTPPPPPVPLPTVSTPNVPLPPPPKPPVTPPKPPVNVPPTPVPVPVPPVPGEPAPLEPEPGGSPSQSSGPAGSAGSGSARLSGASSRIRTISNVRTSRRWLVASDEERAGGGVWITFWLSRGGTVVFLVDRIAPDCRHVGKFVVRAQAGRNAVRFRGRLRGRALDAGTYRLTARPRKNPSRRVAGVTLVILERAAAPAEVSAAEARNTCPDRIAPSAKLSADGTGGAAGGKAAGAVAGVQATAAPRRPYEDDSVGPFGAAVETIGTAARSVPAVLIALALLAVLLLAVAAMPQPVRASRAGAALVHHRGTFALAGVGALVAAVVSFALL